MSLDLATLKVGDRITSVEEVRVVTAIGHFGILAEHLHQDGEIWITSDRLRYWSPVPPPPPLIDPEQVWFLCSGDIRPCAAPAGACVERHPHFRITATEPVE